MYCNIKNCIINQYVLNTGVADWRWWSVAETCSSGLISCLGVQTAGPTKWNVCHWTVGLQSEHKCWFWGQ